MNIPQDTLQAVADAAFKSVTPHRIDEHFYEPDRRAIIQHALDNQALAPFLAGGIGEYTNEELLDASNKVDRMRFTGFDWLRAFLAALPRRESPSLAGAVPSVAYNYPHPEWVDAPEPAAQVPQVDLDQDDFKPGTWVEFPDGTRGEIDFVRRDRVHVGGLLNERTFTELRESGCRINTSIPDTGRWDANAWRPCSKPAGKEVAK